MTPSELLALSPEMLRSRALAGDDQALEALVAQARVQELRIAQAHTEQIIRALSWIPQEREEIAS